VIKYLLVVDVSGTIEDSSLSSKSGRRSIRGSTVAIDDDDPGSVYRIDLLGKELLKARGTS